MTAVSSILGVRQIGAGSDTLYHKSSELGNSLAMSNLAFNLMNGGSYTKSREMAERGLECENPSPRLHTVIAELEKKKEANREQKKIHKDRMRSLWISSGVLFD